MNLPQFKFGEHGRCPACCEIMAVLEKDSGICRLCWRATVLAVAYSGLGGPPAEPPPCPGSSYFYTIGKVDHCGLCRRPKHLAPRPAPPAPGSRWTALYRGAYQEQTWRDENRHFVINEVTPEEVKYSPEGRPHIKFTTRLAEWYVWVSPDGIAMNDTERMKMVPALRPLGVEPKSRVKLGKVPVEGKVVVTPAARGEGALPTYHQLLDTLCTELKIPGSPTFREALEYVKVRYEI